MLGRRRKLMNFGNFSCFRVFIDAICNWFADASSEVKLCEEAQCRVPSDRFLLKSVLAIQLLLLRLHLSFMK